MSSDKQPDGVSDGPVEDSAGAPGGAGAGQDPKNVAELTNYIQSMLQQMQDRWVDYFPIRFPKLIFPPLSTPSSLGSRQCQTR